MFPLVMLTAHEPLSLKTNNNYNPQHQQALAGFLCTQAAEGASSLHGLGTLHK